ncbi:MAG: GGDEF domain-containing protein [Acholeplasmatales bacterium]|nr:GGDEF domain-containing protein [Acholeplasmatales bacterium]
MKNKKKVKGFHTSRFFYPTLILILIFQIIIIVCSIVINSNSKELNKLTKKQTDVRNDITSILSSSSKLSDTIISFAHTPVIIKGPVTDINSGPLSAYYDEISDESDNPDSLIEIFDNYNLSKKVYDELVTSIEKYRILINIQSHVFNLLNKVISSYDIRESEDNNKALLAFNNTLEILPTYTLTEEENNYTIDEALHAANELLFSQEYVINKAEVSGSIPGIITEYNKESNKQIDEYTEILTQFRRILWIVAALTMVVTFIFFITLLIFILFPIIRFSRMIDNNQKLDTNNKLYEPNVLAKAYNELMDRHKDFENKLRIVAEKDTLTGLPNRYSYNEFLQKEFDKEQSICIFMIDINNLKETNDNYGHAKGDKLIKNASLCIKECFLIDNNCYRIGGDEFVAVIENIKEEDIQNYLDKFSEAQKIHNVSIAIGYSYTDNILNTKLEKLVKRADQMMYENKKIIKKQKENEMFVN